MNGTKKKVVFFHVVKWTENWDKKFRLENPKRPLLFICIYKFEIWLIMAFALFPELERVLLGASFEGVTSHQVQCGKIDNFVRIWCWKDGLLC